MDGIGDGAAMGDDLVFLVDVLSLRCFRAVWSRCSRRAYCNCNCGRSRGRSPRMAIDPLGAGRKGQWDLERQQLVDLVILWME